MLCLLDVQDCPRGRQSRFCAIPVPNETVNPIPAIPRGLLPVPENGPERSESGIEPFNAD
jgi:hypothetical protein